MNDKKVYVAPQITSFSNEEILAELKEVQSFRPPVSP